MAVQVPGALAIAIRTGGAALLKKLLKSKAKKALSGNQKKEVLRRLKRKQKEEKNKRYNKQPRRQSDVSTQDRKNQELARRIGKSEDEISAIPRGMPTGRAKVEKGVVKAMGKERRSRERRYTRDRRKSEEASKSREEARRKKTK